MRVLLANQKWGNILNKQQGRLFHTLFNSRFYFCDFFLLERSVPAIEHRLQRHLISKHPHILPILKVVFEYLRLPSKLKPDYFISYSILVSFSVIFHPTDDTENSSFIRMCTSIQA